ncbi:hypothetical protein M2454_002078 [Aequitasia blattaphilus]|uniref:Uncharacterized protein n=1 Tax=Aequitasia blattaphilus TaxID=2949332 RepID=A0ABT1EAB4_9FIRM|nr:hypothetical protein [Aequitasia blattaphilus]MCP1102764.1 hypothetical protein [Aequitasia blattaphilus]MCR8615404.1 hypothetical protein [Aequitasia blattaphilus]
MCNKKSIAYLDVLGFSNYVTGNKNCAYAANMLISVNHILRTKISDYKKMKSVECDERLSELVEKNGVSSFDNLLSFSDSLFITSPKVDEFLKQLSSFVAECFYYHSEQYRNPLNEKKPEEVKSIVVGSDQHNIVEKWYPILFRGGISYEEVIVSNSSIIKESEVLQIPNLIGKGVVQAVGLEQQGKGPKIFIDDQFYHKLSDTMKRFIAKEQDTKYILWPAFRYIWQNDFESEIQHFKHDLEACINLWLAYQSERFGEQYKELLKLVIRSFMKLCEVIYPENYKTAKVTIVAILEKKKVCVSDFVQ